MKRSELVAILNAVKNGESEVDEVIDTIMSTNGKDINNARATATQELETVKAELEQLKAQNTELTTKMDSYKDYEELKAFKTDFEAKTIKARQVDYLKSIGCKHPDLLVNQIDWNSAKYNEEKKTYEGLDDTLKNLKESYKDMFNIEEQSNPNLFKEDLGKGDTESAFMKKYKETHPDLNL